MSSNGTVWVNCATWETDRREAGRELEDLAQHFLDNGRLLAQREDGNRQADQLIRQRHEELLLIRQEMIAWRSTLALRERNALGNAAGFSLRPSTARSSPTNTSTS